VRRQPWPVYTVDVSPDGSRYLWGGGTPGGDCSVTVCDIATNEVLLTLRAHQKPIMRARFLEDGSVVSFSFDSHICRWSPAGELVATNDEHRESRADGFALSSDGDLAAVGHYSGGVSVWHTRDGSPGVAFETNDEKLQVWSVAFEPNGQRLVTGGAGGRIQVWDLSELRRVFEVDLGWGYHVKCLAWHPEGRSIIAAIAPDGTAPKEAASRVVVLDASGYAETASFLPDGHQPLCCVLSRDGSLVAAAGGGDDRSGRQSVRNCVIHLWRYDSGERAGDLAGHAGLVRDLAFVPRGRWLLSAGWDATVRSWWLG